MEDLLARLRKQLPGVRFEPGEAFSWSPAHATVTYRAARADGENEAWSLLHEAAHALLGHAGYKHDVELLLLEAAAWEKAREVAKEFDLTIDEDHVQDALDTYRDWLHQRSTCPRCASASLQISPRDYRCHNCLATWHVSASRFCRPYRLSVAATKKSPEVSRATFQ